LGIDVSAAGWVQRGAELQNRLLHSSHPVLRSCGRRSKPIDMFSGIRSYLFKASDCGLIRESQSTIRRELKFVEHGGGKFGVTIGDTRNFRRDRSLPHFTRNRDGSWFDFQLLLSENAGVTEVVAYDFELRLEDIPQIQFVRLDLNPPDGRASGEVLRSHLHLSSDDDGLSVPAPVLSPFEALDLFLHGLRISGRVRRLLNDDLIIDT
jgi:hypothetical protein